MARKKEEQAGCGAQKEEKKAEKYLSDAESLGIFILQLNKIGLDLRPMPGDGNCLFRSLGDQVDGHSRCHLSHRRAVVQFMSENRADFEPFVEDDVPFEKHVICLSSPGTYAGNDAIVAFARLHQLTVVIHQLNSPLWEIHGSTNPTNRQIHISYHNGDHYSSVRRIGDKSELPNSIRVLNGKLIDTTDSDGRLPALMSPSVAFNSSVSRRKKTGGAVDNAIMQSAPSSDVNSVSSCNDDCKSSVVKSDCKEVDLTCQQDCIDNLAVVTGCMDKKLISDLWLDNSCDFDSTLSALKIVMSGGSPVTSDQQTTSSDSDMSTTSGEAQVCQAARDGKHNGTRDAACAASLNVNRAAKQSKRRRHRDRRQDKNAHAIRHRQVNLVRDKLPLSHSTRCYANNVASSDDSDGDGLVSTVVISDQLRVLQI